MSDQVAMSRTNGQLVIAIPLYRRHHEEALGKLEGYCVSLTSEKPIAYILDCGDVGNQMLNAEFVEANLDFLGAL